MSTGAKMFDDINQATVKKAISIHDKLVALKLVDGDFIMPRGRISNHVQDALDKITKIYTQVKRM